MELVAVMTTVGNIEAARLMAKTVIERKLAACAQLSPIESFYPWEGALQHDQEIRLLFKTTKQNQAALESALAQLHPYAVPAICAFDIGAVNAAYAHWVSANCEP